MVKSKWSLAETTTYEISYEKKHLAAGIISLIFSSAHACVCMCFKSGVVCDGLAELLDRQWCCGCCSAAGPCLMLRGRQHSFFIRWGKIPEGLSTLLTGTQPLVAEPAPKPSSYISGLVAFLFLPHHRSSRTVVIRHRRGKKSNWCTEH